MVFIKADLNVYMKVATSPVRISVKNAKMVLRFIVKLVQNITLQNMESMDGPTKNIAKLIAKT
jgi:hypothetical protein